MVSTSTWERDLLLHSLHSSLWSSRLLSSPAKRRIRMELCETCKTGNTTTRWGVWCTPPSQTKIKKSIQVTKPIQTLLRVDIFFSALLTSSSSASDDAGKWGEHEFWIARLRNPWRNGMHRETTVINIIIKRREAVFLTYNRGLIWRRRNLGLM